MDERGRSRSGSEERLWLQNRLNKIRKEKRSGASFKRRYRSACLKLLSYFIRVLTAQHDQYDPHSLHLSRRRIQAQEQLVKVQEYQLPRRDQPLLPRLEPVPPREDIAYQSEDSFVAETVAVSDEESEAEAEETAAPIVPRHTFEVRSLPVIQPKSPPVIQPKATPPHVAPKLLATTPKLLPTPKHSPQPGSSSSSVHIVPTSVFRPSTARSSESAGVPEPANPPSGARVDSDRVRSLGFRISQLPEFKHTGRLIFSVDWHQVLDAVRFPKETLRTDAYRILPEVQDSFQQLKDRFPGCLIVINSYCCSEYFRKGIASIVHPLVAHTISTEDRTKEKGKFSALTEIATESCILVHFDDSAEVVEEWKTLSEEYQNLGIFGIKVPRHWRSCDRCELASEHLGGGLQQLHCRNGSVILHCCILHHLWPLTCESLQSL